MPKWESRKSLNFHAQIQNAGRQESRVLKSASTMTLAARSAHGGRSPGATARADWKLFCEGCRI